jgi:hypothetical protein
MCGTPAPFLGWISPAVLLPLAASSRSQLTFQVVSTGNQHRLPVRLSPTQKTLQRGCRHAVLSLNCLLRSNVRTIVNISMCTGQILAFTPLATSSLLDALSDHLLPERGLTSCSLHSPDLGASALSLKVHPTSWSIAITPVARK